jgi:hypothetical protein
MKKIIIWSIVIILLGVGEIKCIIKFAESDFEAPYKAEIIYGVGMITGFGSIIGWMDIHDGPITNEKDTIIIRKKYSQY